MNNVEKCCTVGQATRENMAHELECWIPKTTNTHSECAILTAFHYNNGCTTRLNVTLCAYCLSCFSSGFSK